MRSNRMIALAFSVALLVPGCAAFDPGPPPLTAAEIVQLSRAGEPPAAIVERLKNTGTVLMLAPSDVLQMKQDGVAPGVLDYLQAAQAMETRRRAQFNLLLYGPEMSPFSRCGGQPPMGGRVTGFFAPFC